MSDTRASANLRTTLWRVSGAAPSLLDIDGHTLGLFSSTRVDFREAVALARRILERQCDVATISNREITLHVVPQLTTELTPNWYDEWLLVHQERWRQLRLHALDALAERLIEDGRCALAIDAATAAVDSEPLRESGYRCLIQAHLAQGNISEAIRTYRAYCELLMLELGVLPSPMMNDLLASFSFP
ncbi:MAG: SARP family transcriptional regulator [Actinomycetia bacterium]|nr:SARP family transcriptional regulator [Actinomycetes bacterium]